MVKPKPKAKGTIFDSVFEATKVCHLIYQIIQVIGVIYVKSSSK